MIGSYPLVFHWPNQGHERVNVRAGVHEAGEVLQALRRLRGLHGRPHQLRRTWWRWRGVCAIYRVLAGPAHRRQPLVRFRPLRSAAQRCAARAPLADSLGAVQ